MRRADFYRLRDDGVDVFVRLTPGARRDAIEGLAATAEGGRRLKAYVRAVPEAGRANRALERLVARALGVPAGAVALTAGGTARAKTLHVAGPPAALAARLDALASARTG